MEKPKNKKPGRRQTISEENPANLKQKSSPMPIKLKIVRSGTSSDYSVNLGIQEKLESTKMKNLQVIVKKLSDSDIGRLSGSKQSQSDKKIAKKFRNEVFSVFRVNFHSIFQLDSQYFYVFIDFSFFSLFFRRILNQTQPSHHQSNSDAPEANPERKSPRKSLQNQKRKAMQITQLIHRLHWKK
jgi:hypothetical protein